MRRRTNLALVALTLLLSACDGSVAGVPKPGSPARLAAWGAFPDRGTAGQALSVAPAVRVVDAAGTPVPNVEVVFEVASGGGTVASPVAKTGADGVARGGLWTLGPALGEQALTARAGALNASLRTAAEWKWRPVAGSLYTRELTGLAIHPEDDRVWYAMNIQDGLYVTHDGGESWDQPIFEAGLNRNGLRVDPRAPDTVFAAVANRLMVSGDRGRTWTLRHAFEPALMIRSILVSGRDGTLLAAPQWPAGRTPGVFRSEDRGLTWTHHPYGVGEGQQLLTWDLEEDPETGAVWAGNEIADHPQPYRPPFLVSTDGGRSWTDVTSRLPFHAAQAPVWHVIQIESAGGALYALAEGPGLFRSTDGGASWVHLSREFGLELMVDARHAERVFGGNFGGNPDRGWTGAVYASLDRGSRFHRAGSAPAVTGHSVSGMALSSDGTRLYVASYGGGIVMAEIPADGG